MHFIRLLRTGIGTLREHRMPVAVGDAREELLSIRDGTMPWQDVEALRHRLHAEFDRAFAATTLPDRPDYAVIDRLLLRARSTHRRRHTRPSRVPRSAAATERLRPRTSAVLLVFESGPVHEELKDLAMGWLTRERGRHSIGFAHNQDRLLMEAVP
jgi:hypothetical protein